ncbi:NADP-dependent oxidoreductase domain-containing protein [Lipomyces oligophaga]|uniref:NADP-dependent oxidoreductase domain-containing protein n=1 Tax=Lipomyces oligophaga TaxID=45792 RepID=UPI0034CF8DB4
MSLGRHFLLNTGAKIPALGLGTWRSEPAEVVTAVKTALAAGYKHVDTAFIYGNEPSVGDGIEQSPVDRKDIFLTTKLWNSDQQQAEFAFKRSLEHLKTDYLDLYLMHWPVTLDSSGGVVPASEWDYIKTWHAMQPLLGSGSSSARAIGVSNFTIAQLEKLLSHPDTKVVPAANQVELHPHLPQTELLEYCASKGIHVTAYSPLGSASGPLLKDVTVTRLAAKYTKTPAQVLISWAIQRGTSVIPKSVTPKRIISNFDDFLLESQDIKALNDIHEATSQRIVSPPWADYF